MRRQRLPALALAMAGLVAFTSPAMAQTGDRTPVRPGADSAHRMFDPVGRLLAKGSELRLTEEQAARLEEIRARYLEENRERMNSTRARIMAVLTPEQAKQVEEMRKQGHGRWGRHHGRRSGEHRRHGPVRPDSTLRGT